MTSAGVWQWWSSMHCMRQPRMSRPTSRCTFSAWRTSWQNWPSTPGAPEPAAPYSYLPTIPLVPTLCTHVLPPLPPNPMPSPPWSFTPCYVPPKCSHGLEWCVSLQGPAWGWGWGWGAVCSQAWPRLWCCGMLHEAVAVCLTHLLPQGCPRASCGPTVGVTLALAGPCPAAGCGCPIR